MVDTSPVDLHQARWPKSTVAPRQLLVVSPSLWHDSHWSVTLPLTGLPATSLSCGFLGSQVQPYGFLGLLPTMLSDSQIVIIPGEGSYGDCSVELVVPFPTGG